jgi:hypothetical protein
LLEQFLEPLQTGVELLIVVERMSDLVHYEVGVLEETQYAVVEFNADVVSVLFHAE